VTSEQEAQESAGRFPNAQVALIPNGVEIPSSVVRLPSSVSGRKSHRELRLVYLGRLDPKKGIENLLQARSMLNGDLGSLMSVTIAGAGDAEYAQDIQAAISHMAPAERPKMIGYVSGSEKAKLFEHADVVIVPSYTENFGLVVAEALAHGVPVIASKGTPWQRVEEIGCGLWVDNSPESLAAAVKQISRMPLREMGQRGREWMQREYSWDLMGKRTMELYASVVTPHAN
jgi:glycosyltransferase involved in cell wall biosynthesis